MTSPPNEERRPAKAAISKSSLAGEDTPIIRLSAEQWAGLAAHADGAFVVVVKTNHDRYRRRAWMTLAPAERAAEKAREAGHDAVVMLCELKPLHRVSGAA